MKSCLKSLLCISLSLIMCAFTCVGYAKVSTALNITGEAVADAPSGIFITSITELRSSNIDKNEFSFFPVTTNIESHIRRGAEASQGIIEYEVTVFNNTNTTYYYRDIYFQTKNPVYNGNDYISDDQEDGNITIVCVFDEDNDDAKKLVPKESVTFSVIYTLGENIPSDLQLDMLINVRFGIHVSGEGEAIDAVEKRFLEILNTPSTYNYLVDVLDNKFDGVNEWTSNYVGNVTGAYNGAFSDDSVAVNTLFQNQLQMTIDGEPREVTVIIKHEDVDWLTYTGDDYVVTHPNGTSMSFYGCEMTLYLTIDPLDTPNSLATVYALVFTCDIANWETYERGNWYRLGTTFVGKAPVVDYVTGEAPGTGSFQTTGWYPASTTYTAMDGYHYEIKNGDKVDTFHLDAFSYSVVPAEKNFLHFLLETSTKDSLKVIKDLLSDAERILYNKDYAGEGINRLWTVYYKYYWTYAYLDTSPEVNTWPHDTVGKFHPAIQELYKTIDSVLSDISSLNE